MTTYFSRPLYNCEIFYAKFGIGIVAESHSLDPIDPILAQEVIDYLQKYHPFMRMVIVKIESQFFFKEAPNTKIEVKVNKGSYSSIMKKWINIFLPLDKLFEILIIKDKGKDIFLTKSHHSVSDGVSVQALHNDFFKALERLTQHKRLEKKESYNIPSPQDYIPKEILKLDVHKIASDYHKKFDALKPPASTQTSDSPLKIHLINKKISGVPLEKLIHKCREHKVKLNSLICAALIESNASLLKARNHSSHIYLDIPINLRPFIDKPIPADHLGSVISWHADYFDLDAPLDVWQRAKEMNHTFHDKFDLTTVFSFAHAMNAIFADVGESNFPAVSLYTSNLGVVKFDTTHFKINEFAFFAQAYAPLIITFSTCENTLHCSFAYTTPFCSSDLAKALSNNFMTLLKKLF